MIIDQKLSDRGTRLKVGQAVRTLSSVRPRRHANRTGIVAQNHDGEVGVRFGSAATILVWFLPSELDRFVAGRPDSASVASQEARNG